MIRIALTGSIALGKSTVSRMFEAAGIPLFDADRAVHHLQDTDELLIAAIGERFAGTVRDGKIDRDALRQRALDRPGMTQAKLDAMLARQMPDAEKRRRADFVIDNGGGLSTTERQVDDIIACLGLAARR
jgi:dephospho-CoA kinase